MKQIFIKDRIPYISQIKKLIHMKCNNDHITNLEEANKNLSDPWPESNNNIANKMYWKSNSLIMNNKSLIRIFLLLTICLLSWVGIQIIHAKAKDGNLQEGIAKDIIRFHVIANSDSKEDQELKLKVKDALVKELSPLLHEADDIEESRLVIQNNFSLIENLAREIIQQNGYDYLVQITLEPYYFPMKVYGEYTFPPGNYEALRVQIGDAQGKNWWCVMFPPLCFVDETYSIVDPEAENQLKHILTEDELDILKNQKIPIKYKFKLWESIKKLFG